MINLTFPGYQSFAAQTDDPMRVKWNEMRADLTVPAGFPEPVAGVMPFKGSIGTMNFLVNRDITFDKLETENLSAWQTPAQTVVSKHGNCKDYALLKYALLTNASIPAQVVIGDIRDMPANIPHAWCAVYIDGAWWALDNLFDQLIKVEEYINWTPKAAMHDDSVVEFGVETTIDDVFNKTKV